MPILNLNGVERKNAKPVKGRIFAQGLSNRQHPTVGFVGKTYNSPFTSSDVPPLGTQVATATQRQLPALKSEYPGKTVGVHQFVKVHPWEKGATFSTNQHRPVVSRQGGPSRYADTPANPNAVNLRAVNRPRRYPVAGKNETQTNLSFIRSGGTLAGKSNTDQFRSRWSTIKKGAAG